MAVDERRKVRLEDLAVVPDDIRAILEVADPERMRRIASPSASHFLPCDAQLHSRRPGLFQMAVECRFWNGPLVQDLEELVDHPIRAIRLIFLEFDRFVDDLSGNLSRFAPIVAAAAVEALKTSLLILVPFAPERRERRLVPFPIGQSNFLFAQLAQKATDFGLGNLAE